MTIGHRRGVHVPGENARVFATLCLVGVVGCSDEGKPTDGPQTSQVSQRLTAPAELTIEFDIPGGHGLANALVLGSDGVTIADRGKIDGWVGSIDGPIAVTHDSRTGTLAARTTVTVGDRTTVEGDIRAGGTVQQGSGASVTGSVSSGTQSRGRGVLLARGGHALHPLGAELGDPWSIRGPLAPAAAPPKSPGNSARSRVGSGAHPNRFRYPGPPLGLQ